MSWSRMGIAVALVLAASLGCSKAKDPPQVRPSATSSAGATSNDSAPAGNASAPKGNAGQAEPGPSATPPGVACWPRFHGPKQDNLSTETGLLKEWPKTGPTLIWTAKGLGHGFASVALDGGLIYTAGNQGDKTIITALDLDGKPRWQTDNGPAWTGQYPGTRSTPTIDGDRLYYESPLGELACLNAKSGEKIWSVNILNEFEGENITWALAESVLIDGDRVICSPGGKKASVAALDKKTGKKIWITTPTGAKAGYASPTVAECQGLRMILTMDAKAFLGVNATTGELLFTFPHETSYDVNATSPIYHEGHVFITSGYGSGCALLKLNVDGQKASVEEVWKSKDLDNHHGGVILLDGYLYGAASGGSWDCLEWKTGARKYRERGVGKGSLTYADGMLYTLSEKNVLGLVQATPASHKVVSKFTVPSGGEGASWAHPVICGGRLYVRHSDRLFAYDVRAGRN